MEKMVITVLAKPSHRYLASIIDGLVVALLSLPIFLWTSDTKLILTIGFFLYKVFVYLLVDFLVPYITKGQTIGRYFMGLRLVRKNGQYASIKNYLLRAIIFVVIAAISIIFDMAFIAYLLRSIVFALSIYWIYTDDYRMTVHDKIAGTIIIKELNIVRE